MRIISQDGCYDVPYESIILVSVHSHYGINAVYLYLFLFFISRWCICIIHAILLSHSALLSFCHIL